MVLAVFLRNWYNASAGRLQVTAVVAVATVGVAPAPAGGADSSSALAKLIPFQRQCFPTAEPCILLLNQYGSFGCAQCGEDLISAPVVELNSDESLRAFLQVEEAGPRAVLLPANLLFEGSALQTLAESPKNVAAVLIAWEQAPGVQPPARYSPASMEPNGNASLAGSVVPGGWNPQGFNLFSRYYPFNVFLLPPSVVDVIRLRTRRFRGGPTSSEGDGDGGGGGGVGSSDNTAVSGTLEDQFPRFVVQSMGQMWACNKTVSDCLADNTCLPVGGQSVWAAATRLRPTAPAEAYVAVSAPMDSTAFFHSRAVGAVAEVSALVTMLAVAEAFGAVVAANRTRQMARIPVFMALNAEAYGYAGSRRFLNDIIKFECEDEEDAGSMGSGVCEKPRYMSTLKFQTFRRRSDGTEEGRASTRFTHVLDVGPVGSAAKAREPVSLVPANASAVADATPQPVSSDDLRIPPFFVHAAENSTGLRDLLLAAFARVDAPPVEGGPSNVDLAVRSSTSWTVYPPTSGQSFISEVSSPSGPPQVVTLVDYDDEFRDAFYHSELSQLPADPAPLAAAIALAARGLVRTLVALAYFDVVTTPNEAAATAVQALATNAEYLALADTAADGVLLTSINGLLTCLTGNWTDCELASDLLGDSIRDQLARSVSPSNFAGTYVPPTRASTITPSGAAKVRLLRAFLANATAYAGATGEPVRCDDACAGTLEADREALHCVRDRCVAADAYTHNAYGHGLEPTNSAQSSFVLRDDNSSVGDGAWTESYWDSSLGVCGATEDAFVLSIGILFAGLGVLVGAVILSAVISWSLSEGKGTSVVRGAEGGVV
ncbi:hypothetical protein MMPV_007102 [Pyropia vietnamensis]